MPVTDKNIGSAAMTSKVWFIKSLKNLKGFEHIFLTAIKAIFDWMLLPW